LSFGCYGGRSVSRASLLYRFPVVESSFDRLKISGLTVLMVRL
jgi:hypothetical protein